MSRTILAASTIAALLATGCAAPRSGAAASSTTGAPGAQTARADPKQQLICRTERPTGSNIPQRVCYTQEELDAKSLSAQDALRQATQNTVQTVK